MFTPVENIGLTSSVRVCKYQDKEGNPYITTMFINQHLNKFEEEFYRADGSVYSTKVFEIQPENQATTSLINIPFTFKGKPCILLAILDGYFVLTDQNFQIIKLNALPAKINHLFAKDLNKDGNEELLFSNTNGEQVAIIDPGLQNPLWQPILLKAETRTPMVCGVRHNGPLPDELYFLSYERLYFYTYQANPLYYWKYALWLLIYGLLVLILWVSERLQTIQTRRKQKMEETINSLQMRVFKSQMPILYNWLV